MDKLNARIPLSVAHWHRHVNWCLPKLGQQARIVGGPNNHEHAAKVEALVYVLEAVVAAAMSVAAAQEGKRGLPFAWAIAAAGFVMGAVMRWRRGTGR